MNNERQIKKLLTIQEANIEAHTDTVARNRDIKVAKIEAELTPEGFLAKRLSEFGQFVFRQYEIERTPPKFSIPTAIGALVFRRPQAIERLMRHRFPKIENRNEYLLEPVTERQPRTLYHSGGENSVTTAVNAYSFGFYDEETRLVQGDFDHGWNLKVLPIPRTTSWYNALVEYGAMDIDIYRFTAMRNGSLRPVSDPYFHARIKDEKITSLWTYDGSQPKNELDIMNTVAFDEVLHLVNKGRDYITGISSSGH